jgi:hypothetical protein
VHIDWDDSILSPPTSLCLSVAERCPGGLDLACCGSPRFTRSPYIFEHLQADFARGPQTIVYALLHVRDVVEHGVMSVDVNILGHAN